jgi:pilus assembly protein Flp/PilA
MFEYIRNCFRYSHDEEGATAVEYGIMVAAIAAVIIVVVLALGGKVNAAFQKVETNMPASAPITSQIL